MEAGTWDVIVVGARCAGSTLAVLLAKQGLSVLLLEASPRGTDMPLSTHLIQAAGIDVLDRLGVGEKVRAAAPPTKVMRYALDESVVMTPNLPGRASYCVRRSVIDPWLQDAAEESGATFLDRHRVVDLVRDGHDGARVTGVVARGPDGLKTFHARLVVGADGMHSTVAKLAGAEEYLVADGTRAGYWGYFPAPEKWTKEWDATLENRGDDLRYAFRTDGDLVTLVYAGPAEEVRAWGRDHRARFMEAIARSPELAELSAGKEPVGKVIGVLKTRFFYRRAVGPGFALVGDAGHFKDFVTGLGMADAFVDAERLVPAILDGRPEAFAHYWRKRDAETLPLHFDALQQGAVGYNSPFTRWVIANVGKREELRKRVAMMLDRQIDPNDMIPMKTMLAWMGSALVRGRFDVLSGFMKTGKALGEEAKILAERRALLAEAEAALARAPAAVRLPEAPPSQAPAGPPARVAAA